MKKPDSSYIENKFLDKLENYNEESFMNSIKAQLCKTLENHRKVCPPERARKIYSDGKEKIDYTFYTGSGGNIYAFWRYYLLTKKSNEEQEIESSKELLKEYYYQNLYLLQKDLSNKKKFTIPTFFQGPVGI